MCARQAISEDPTLWQSFKRQSIQEAVVRLMCREGLAAVTMERVAQETGIAKGTVYLHYRDKQELLDAVKESALAPLTTLVDEVLRSDSTPERKLRTYAVRYLGYFQERRDLLRILLYEREVNRSQGSRYKGSRYRHFVEEASRVIQEGIEAGIFREIEARMAAAIFVESVIAVVYQRLLGERAVPFEEDAALVSDLFLRGIAGRRKK